MPRRRILWAAICGSLLVNVFLLGLAPLLGSERGLPEDDLDTVAVSLVKLAPPEPPKQERTRQVNRPKQEPKRDFTPDLVKPALSRAGAGVNLGVVIDLGGIGGGDVGGDFVFEAYELDTAPQVMVRVPPAYPYKAREQGVEGVVQVKLLVLSDGSVGQVLILGARPEGYFEEAVQRAVPQWKFSPGKIDGEAVTAWVVTSVRFEF